MEEAEGYNYKWAVILVANGAVMVFDGYCEWSGKRWIDGWMDGLLGFGLAWFVTELYGLGVRLGSGMGYRSWERTAPSLR